MKRRPADLQPSAALESPQKKILLANRVDGFGERLCAMINALRLADYLGAEFRFAWTDKIWSNDYNRTETAGPANILGQSIDARDQVFSKTFIQDYGLNYWSYAMFDAVPKKQPTSAALAASEKRGWYTTQHHIADEYGAEIAKNCTLSTQDAFNKIGFADAAQRAIEQARAVAPDAFVAIHLRSGDMVYGEVRKWGFWGNKVLNPIVAVDLIKQAQAKGQKVVMFGQDVDWLVKAKTDYGILLAQDLTTDDFACASHRALFELVLMSRATEIYAGDSGFARAAGMIADRPVKSMFAVYSPIRYSDVTLAGLDAAPDQVNPLMAAYSYWQAYAFGRTLRSVPQLIETISKAHRLDPDNHLYFVILVALKYRMGEDAEAEALLDKSYGEDKAHQAATMHPVDQQITFRYFTPKYTHEEQFPDFIAAARRSGNYHARHIAKLIRAEKS